MERLLKDLARLEELRKKRNIEISNSLLNSVPRYENDPTLAFLTVMDEKVTKLEADSKYQRILRMIDVTKSAICERFSGKNLRLYGHVTDKKPR